MSIEMKKDLAAIAIQWKRDNIPVWTRNFDRVHVGRINTARWLWVCHDAGAESVDGTGWFRGDRLQLAGLYDYLRGVRKRCRDQTLLQFSVVCDY